MAGARRAAHPSLREHAHTPWLPEEGRAGVGEELQRSGLYHQQGSYPQNWTHSTPEGKVLGAGNLGPKPVNSTRWKPTKSIPMQWFTLAFLFSGFIKQTLMDWVPFVTGHTPEAWRGSATLRLAAPRPPAGACISDEVCKHPKKWTRWRITQGEEAGPACQGWAFLPGVRVCSSPAGKQPAWGGCLQGACPFFMLWQILPPKPLLATSLYLGWVFFYPMTL